MVRPEIRASGMSTWKAIKVQIDNGAAANCLTLEDYNQIEKPRVLDKSKMKLTTYSGNRIVPEGQLSLFRSIDRRE